MTSAQPHFFLRCEARVEGKRGEWTFALTAADGSAELKACDEEYEVTGERLELLAVVRALEALDQPSVVTITAGARTVRRAVAEGLDEWRQSGWMWECYGEMAPIKNRDLWMRLDRALRFHRLETRRVFRIDAAHVEPQPTNQAEHSASGRRSAVVERADAADDSQHLAAHDADADRRVDSSPAAESTNDESASLARRMKETWLRARRRSRNRSEGMTMASAQFGASLSAGAWRI